ncbi:MAG TPA: HypC/HybG/HupF family hydrogenase formation chaperone [Streptosporangiaceae bacterium]|nr:HypC/HybG/HupF family hydrogenase formation chaperone [Streptosporangiaceae bacterium]
MTSDAGRGPPGALEHPGPRPAERIPPQAAEWPSPQAGECTDEVCVTCSDTAVAVTIARLLPDDLAVVDTGAGEEEVSVALVTAEVGDTILVHAGEAIAVVGR